MSALLVEALKSLDLQPGQTFRTTVNGHVLEVRVLDDTPAPELAEQVMLLPWVELPFGSAGTVRARRGTLPLPDPPVIPEDEGEIE